ncbi:MAG: hypothetical protein JNK87_30865 [Bryobacterales bacterium]|nr:hypothetical protein [Bryobacterales bacterium]
MPNSTNKPKSVFAAVRQAGLFVKEFAAIGHAVGLPSTTLHSSLNEAFLTIAVMLERCGVKLTREIIEEEIPGAVFNLAVAANWMPEIAADGATRVHSRRAASLTRLGDYEVESSFKDRFIADISYALEECLASVDPGGRNSLPAPTTREERRRLLDSFLTRHQRSDGTHFTRADIAAFAGVEVDYVRKWLACYERAAEKGKTRFTTKAGTPRSDRVVELLIAEDIAPFEASLRRKVKPRS